MPDRKTMRLPDRKTIELVWLENASHSLLIEEPVAVAKHIDRFIHRVEKR